MLAIRIILEAAFWHTCNHPSTISQSPTLLLLGFGSRKGPGSRRMLLFHLYIITTVYICR